MPNNKPVGDQGEQDAVLEMDESVIKFGVCSCFG